MKTPPPLPSTSPEFLDEQENPWWIPVVVLIAILLLLLMLLFGAGIGIGLFGKGKMGTGNGVGQLSGDSKGDGSKEGKEGTTSPANGASNSSLYTIPQKQVVKSQAGQKQAPQNSLDPQINDAPVTSQTPSKGDEKQQARETGLQSVSGDPNAESNSNVATNGDALTAIDALGEDGGGGGASFFGTQAEGGSFVFVIDRSSSMGGPKFTRAVAELRRSIEALNRNQRFAVIFFADHEYPQPTWELVWGTDINKKEVLDWINGMQPEGGTRPPKAIYAATELKPDAVFLLSDGEFAPFDVDFVIQECLHGCPIHSIAFQTTSNSLQVISARSGGTYRAIQ